MKQIIVLPGASSPVRASNIEEYAFLRFEAEKRNIQVNVLDFVGCGHYSSNQREEDCGAGLSIPTAAQKVLPALRSADEDSVLFCRCSGCDVGAHIMANHQDDLSKFRRIVFWAAISGPKYWEIVPDITEKLDSFNAHWAEKGWKVHPEFWAEYIPIDAQLLRCKWSGELTLAAGPFDDRTNPEFQRYLAALVNRHTTCSATAVEIPEAQHRVTAEILSPRGRDAYLAMLFERAS